MTVETGSLEQSVVSFRTSVQRWQNADAAYSAFADAADENSDREYPLLSCQVLGPDNQKMTVELDPNELDPIARESFGQLCSAMIVEDYTDSLSSIVDLGQESLRLIQGE